MLPAKRLGGRPQGAYSTQGLKYCVKGIDFKVRDGARWSKYLFLSVCFIVLHDVSVVGRVALKR
jgi:hypothetical protein